MPGKLPAWHWQSFTLLHQTKILLELKFCLISLNLWHPEQTMCFCLALLASVHRIILGCFEFWCSGCTHSKLLWTRALIRCLKCTCLFLCVFLRFTADVWHHIVPFLACWRHGSLAFLFCITSHLLFLVVRKELSAHTHTHTFAQMLHYTITHTDSLWAMIVFCRQWEWRLTSCSISVSHTIAL